jgi:hypothetical protein
MKGESRMSNQESNARIERQEQERPVQRRPYVKPGFSCEQVFESTALGCLAHPGASGH